MKIISYISQGRYIRKKFQNTLILAFRANSALSRENETKLVKITHNSAEANDECVHFFGTEFIERLLFPTLPDKSVLKNEILVDIIRHGHRSARKFTSIGTKMTKG